MCMCISLVRVSITFVIFLCSPKPIQPMDSYGPPKPIQPMDSYGPPKQYPMYFPYTIQEKIQASEQILNATKFVSNAARTFFISKKLTISGIQKLHIVKKKILTAKNKVFQFKKSFISKHMSGWGWRILPKLPLPGVEDAKRLGVRMGYMGGSRVGDVMRRFMRGYNEKLNLGMDFATAIANPANNDNNTSDFQIVWEPQPVVVENAPKESSHNDTSSDSPILREPEEENAPKSNETGMKTVHQFFEILKQLDNNETQCFEKLICDIHAKKFMNGSKGNLSDYEEGVISIFRVFDFPDNHMGTSSLVDDPVTSKYILAADFGKENPSRSQCEDKYKLCPFSTNEYTDFGNEVPDSKEEDGVPMKIS